MKTSRRTFIKSAPLMTSIPLATLESQAQNRPAASGLIDCQSHLFLRPVVDMMRKRKTDPHVYEEGGTTFLQMGPWLRKIPPHYMSIETKLAAMDEAGIQTTMLSTNDPGPEWFGTDGPSVSRLIHDSLADIARQYPSRFRPLCVLPMQNENAALDELDRCIKLGFKGLLLYANLAGSWCDEPQFRWVFARAEELGFPILLHPAKPMTTEQVKGYELTSTMGNMFDNTIALARIIASGLLDMYPKLKLVCPHLGGTLPYISGRMDHQIAVLKRSNQNLERKPSEYMRSIYMDIVSPLAEAMQFAINFSGPDKLLFSSDHPWVLPKYIIEPFRSLNLPEEDEEKIFSGNAKQLFGL